MLADRKVSGARRTAVLVESSAHEYSGHQLEAWMSLTVLGDLTRRRGACALIAIKERARCKTRLADVLRPPERIDLVRSMLTQVLAAAENAQTVHQVIVISPERDTVPAEIPVLADTGESLNNALIQAHTVLREFGCHAVVVLPAD